MKSSWNKISRLSTSFKADVQARKKRQKSDWEKYGELKGIRSIDKKFVRKS